MAFSAAMAAARPRRTPGGTAQAVRSAAQGRDERRSAGPPLTAALLGLQHQAGNAAVASAMGATAVRRAAGAHDPTADCPGYGPGEVKKSQSDNGMLVSDVTELPSALRIADFGVNSSTVRESIKRHPLVQSWFAALESNTTLQLDVLGLDDCVGPASAREKLRDRRAKSVLALLGPSAQSRVRFAGAAPPDQYSEDAKENLTSVDRARNRSVLVQFNQTLDMKDKTVSARPVPRRLSPGCTSAQLGALTRAQGGAMLMVQQALLATPPRPSKSLDDLVHKRQVDMLLERYFKDSGHDTRIAVAKGFRRIAEGLKATDFSRVVYDCTGRGCKDTWHAYVRGDDSDRSLFPRVYFCPAGFGFGDPELAATIVHEYSHLYDNTDDKKYCEGGCPAALTTADCIANADSYSEFAQELVTRGL
jgi:outer membrane protein OmpA-like peptidoglycan-associated protein